MNESIESDSPGDYSRTTSTDYITASWSMLPPHVREAIVTLVDAALVNRQQIPKAETSSANFDETT